MISDMELEKIVLVAIASLGLAVVAGCFPGAPALSSGDLKKLKADLEKIDHLSGDIAVKLEKSELESAVQKAPNGPGKARDLFLTAYCAERLGNYEEALTRYEAFGRSPYRSMAFFRMGEVAAHAPAVMEADKRALKGYSGAGGYYPTGEILVRYPPLASQPLREWKSEQLRIAANSRADRYHRNALSYKAIDALVSFTGRNRSFSYGFAIFLIAIIVKIVTTPLSNRQFKSLREMQALQPLLNELQRKHKGDREAMMREQMKLFREHKINPLGGCLPLLVQLPFLIWVYRAVWAYNWQFEEKQFLWIANLAGPDTPLLLLYAASLYFSQKLTITPTADPQQRQMQRMMAILFPIMFLMMFKLMPAAFILYWFAQNVLMTAHQYYAMKRNPQPALAEKPTTKTIKRK